MVSAFCTQSLSESTTFDEEKAGLNKNMINWFWIQFAAICIVGAMSPGPSLALIIRNSIKYGRISGLLSSIGHAIGIGIYAAISVVGLQLILINYPKAVTH